MSRVNASLGDICSVQRLWITTPKVHPESQVHMPSHPKEPLLPTECPIYPFQKVCADYFEVKDHHYLVYVDRYSGWNRTFWFPQGGSTSTNLISALRTQFEDMGVPEELACDRGSNLTSSEITTWLRGWGDRGHSGSVGQAASHGPRGGG